MVRPDVAIIIPALNESATIGDVVRAAKLHGVVIVVDDGSTDGTADIATAAGADIVRHDTRRGYDGALNAGFERAASLDCSYAITCDADGQHDPAALGRITTELDHGADVVVGKRNRRQRFAERLFGWIAHVRWGISDPLCGVKGYRLAIYRELGHFDSYGSIGTEMMLFAARRRRRIVEVPIEIRMRVDAPRFGNRLQANLKILRALTRALT